MSQIAETADDEQYTCSGSTTARASDRDAYPLRLSSFTHSLSADDVKAQIVTPTTSNPPSTISPATARSTRVALAMAWFSILMTPLSAVATLVTLWLTIEAELKYDPPPLGALHVSFFGAVCSFVAAQICVAVAARTERRRGAEAESAAVHKARRWAHIGVPTTVFRVGILAVVYIVAFSTFVH